MKVRVKEIGTGRIVHYSESLAEVRKKSDGTHVLVEHPTCKECGRTTMQIYPVAEGHIAEVESSRLPNTTQCILKREVQLSENRKLLIQSIRAIDSGEDDSIVVALYVKASENFGEGQEWLYVEDLVNMTVSNNGDTTSQLADALIDARREFKKFGW